MLPFEIEHRLEEIKSQIAQLGAELIDISLRRAGSRSVLTVLVDKQGGVTLDDCAAINRRLGDYFDAESQKGEVIAGAYYLEVNSPGLDRPLKTAQDFERVIGERVRVTHVDDAGAHRTLVGEVLSVQNSMLELKPGAGTAVFVGLERVTRAVRDIQF